MQIRLLLPLALAVLTACPPERDCDADRDGFESSRCGGDDCNDATYLVNPEAPEICDGLDNDCDGDPDLPPPADPPIWYADGDGDGAGDPDVTAAACDPPLGYVNNGLDCDDSRTLVRPGALEVCDEQDNDCDGEIDEDDAEFAPDWWRDGDGDGYGNPTSAVITACNAPDGYSNNDEDCDDSEADVHPGAEDPCDGRDSDCDGIVEAIWYADTDGDGFGDTSSSQDACDPGDGWSPDGGDCNDGRNDVFPGAPEICADGVENSCDGLAPGCGIAGVVDLDSIVANTILGEGPNDGFGRAVAVGDLADTGTPGVIVSPFADNAVSWFADLIAGGPTAADADAILNGETNWTGGIATGRDVTGDGVDDVLVGDALNNTVTLFAGPLDGPVDTDAAVATGEGGAGTSFGFSVALLPDLNDDGIGDIAVGAPTIGGGGRVFVFAGGAAPVLDAEDPIMTLRGEAYGFGWSVVGVDDVSEDGAPEIVVGAPFDNPPRVDLFSGLVAGTRTQSEAWATLAVDDFVTWEFGFQVASAGDLDGDGATDLLLAGSVASVGLPDATAWVWSPQEGFAFTDDVAVQLVGGPIDTFFPDLVRAAVVGDLDGDGTAAVALSWPSANLARAAIWDPSSFTGGTLEAADAEAIITGIELFDDERPPQLAAAGDLDDDGYDDLIVTEPGDDDGTGALHVLLGGPGL